MVQLALDQLASENIVELDDERRAAMVSNLLVLVMLSLQLETQVVEMLIIIYRHTKKFYI